MAGTNKLGVPTFFLLLLLWKHVIYNSRISECDKAMSAAAGREPSCAELSGKNTLMLAWLQDGRKWVTFAVRRGARAC